MSPKGAGIRPADMKPISASDISVNLGSDTENKVISCPFASRELALTPAARVVRGFVARGPSSCDD